MTAEAPHILVVDDDVRLRELLRKYLKENGFRVTIAAGAEESRARLVGFAFDLLVLDVMMPGETGIALTAWLRDNGRVPVLLLTARAEAEDRIAGLEAGAEDYLVKPFEPRELVLRIRTILRRVALPPVPTDITFGPFRFSATREELFRGEDIVRLTSVEAGLLRAFAANPGAVLSREELMRQCSGIGNPRTADVQVTRLRRKIEDDPKLPRYLHTVRGSGYVLRID